MMNLDRVQRYLQTLSRIPSEEEAADIINMSRRGFFGATAAISIAPYFADGDLSRCANTLISKNKTYVFIVNLPEHLNTGDRVVYTGMEGRVECNVRYADRQSTILLMSPG